MGTRLGFQLSTARLQGRSVTFRQPARWIYGGWSTKAISDVIWGETSTKNVLVKTKHESFNWVWQTTELHFSLGAVCLGWSTDSRNFWSDFAEDRRLTTGIVEMILVGSSTNHRNCWSDFSGIVDKLQELLKWFCGIVDKLQELLKWFWWDRRQTTGTVEVILVGSSTNYRNCWSDFSGIVDKLQELLEWF